MGSEWMGRIRAWYAGRNARERRVLMLGSAVLLGLLGYDLIYAPLEQARARLLTRLPALRAELRLMQVQTAEIERLRNQMTGPGKGSLEQRIKASAAVFGLGGTFTQFTVLMEDRIQLATQPIPNGTWIEWLSDLQRQGVNVAECQVSLGDQVGPATLKLTLTGAH
ncbi:MAG TPA: type II secretion system protein M [Thiobacillaceae bacterium]|nr:type II secretion system protein M [Thiobacillaceae bacterium]HNU64068.1 type II secretion system protein M [Thiobacillaceae bacterium]